MAQANDAFYATTPPSRTFRTSAASAGPVAAAIVERLDAVAGVAPPHVALTVVDVGCGEGALLMAVRSAVGHRAPTWEPRLRLVGLDLHPPPDGTAAVEWIAGDASAPPLARLTGVVVAHEFLDDLGIDIVHRRPTGPAIELVDEDGMPSTLPLDSTDPRVAWADLWWPDAPRVECGLLRDQAWARAVAMLDSGYAVAVDYGHLRLDRPDASTLIGWSMGHPTSPVADGSMNVTAHVAIDSLAAAGERVAGRRAWRRLQSDVLGRVPMPAGSGAGARARLAAIDAAARQAELTDPQGLGAHHWLVQPVGMAPSPE
jgi:hypothetical protein